MKTKNLFGILMLFLFTFTSISCNKEKEFSKEEIQQVLFDMKGTYHGTVHVSAPICLKSHIISKECANSIKYEKVTIEK